MEAYFFGQRKAVPGAFAEWLAPEVSAAVSIDMHRGHLDDSPECPCPAPRAREIIEPINAFHRECRRLGVPVIHVKTVLRATGVGKKRLSIFYPTDLDFLLRNMRRRTVVLTGGFTDCCVLNAAFAASRMTIVSATAVWLPGRCRGSLSRLTTASEGIRIPGAPRREMNYRRTAPTLPPAISRVNRA